MMAIDRRLATHTIIAAALVAGCITPQYAIRQTPHPVESPGVLAVERKISAIQAQELTRNHQLVDPSYAAARGFDVPRILQRLVAVSERPYLLYQVLVIDDGSPNAAALADGRLFITTGMLDYLAQRGSREDELAFILGHELAHTVAQHLVKRVQQMQWTQVVTGLAGAAAAGLTAGASGAAQGAGQIGSTIANVAGNVYVAGYSQGQELEADQLGARYVIRAGYDPLAGIRMLEDFQRFDPRGLYLSTHPYSARRAADLTQFLLDIGWQPKDGSIAPAPASFAPPRVPAPADAPRLRLEHIQWNASMPSKRRAIINGHPVKMGDFIDGAQVILIDQRRVQLFQDGREFLLELR